MIHIAREVTYSLSNWIMGSICLVGLNSLLLCSKFNLPLRALRSKLEIRHSLRPICPEELMVPLDKWSKDMLCICTYMEISFFLNNLSKIFLATFEDDIFVTSYFASESFWRHRVNRVVLPMQAIDTPSLCYMRRPSLYMTCTAEVFTTCSTAFGKAQTVKPYMLILARNCTQRFFIYRQPSHVTAGRFRWRI